MRSLAWFVLLATSTAVAQPAANKAEAQALFDEGQRLLRDGRIAQACATFEASLARVAGLGTRGKLAECYERAGRVASAWAQWREVAARAHQDGDARREQFALDRIDVLVPRLPRLRISAKTSGLTISRDGVAIDPAALGVAIAIDPGHHTIEARADGFVAWRQEIEIGDAEQAELDVPALVRAPLPAVRPVVRRPVMRRSPLRVPSIVAIAGGGALVITGGVFGIRAYGAWSDAEEHCPDARCDPSGLASSDRARRDARRADYFVGGGLVFAAVGAVVFWRTRGEHALVAPAVSPSMVGLAMEGRF